MPFGTRVSGLASVVSTFDGPVANTQALVLPGASDHVMVFGGRYLQIDNNYAYGSISLSQQANSSLIIDVATTLTIAPNGGSSGLTQIQNEVSIGAGGELIVQGRMMVTASGYFTGSGIVRIDGATNANNRRILNRDTTFAGGLRLSNGAELTVSASIDLGGTVTIDNGCTLRLERGARLANAVSIVNNGSIVCDCGAGNVVVIEGTISGTGSTTEASGNVNTSGSPTSAAVPGHTLETASPMTLGSNIGESGAMENSWYYFVTAAGTEYTVSLPSKSGGTFSAYVYTFDPETGSLASQFILTDQSDYNTLTPGEGEVYIMCFIPGMGSVDYQLNAQVT